MVDAYQTLPRDFRAQAIKKIVASSRREGDAVIPLARRIRKRNREACMPVRVGGVVGGVKLNREEMALNRGNCSNEVSMGHLSAGAQTNGDALHLHEPARKVHSFDRHDFPVSFGNKYGR
jgi:hypothetical protein